MSYANFLKQLFNLDSRVVFITGASSGIGAHAAHLFAQAGCRVVVTARRAHKVEALADQLVQTGAEAMAIEMDVGSRGSVEQGVEHAVRRFGGVDILLNNAGIAKTGRFLELEEDDWNAVIDTNLGGVWRVGQVIGRQMARQKSGCIVNVSSILGAAVQRRQANYGSAKAAVTQLTRNMALELGPMGIRVNAIAPGYFGTGINQAMFASDKGKAYIESLFPGRAGNLEELDGLLLLLTSDAGSYIQGSVVTIDGGTLLGDF